jgi:hypothetical protein
MEIYSRIIHYRDNVFDVISKLQQFRLKEPCRKLHFPSLAVIWAGDCVIVCVKHWSVRTRMASWIALITKAGAARYEYSLITGPQ